MSVGHPFQRLTVSLAGSARTHMAQLEIAVGMEPIWGMWHPEMVDAVNTKSDQAGRAGRQDELSAGPGLGGHTCSTYIVHMPSILLDTRFVTICQHTLNISSHYDDLTNKYATFSVHLWALIHYCLI